MYLFWSQTLHSDQSMGFLLPSRNVLNTILMGVGSQQWLCRWSTSLEKFCELICSRQWAEDMGCSPLLLPKPLKAAQQAELFCCRSPSLSPAALRRAAVILGGASNVSQPDCKALDRNSETPQTLGNTSQQAAVQQAAVIWNKSHESSFFQQRLIIQKKGHIQAMRHGVAKRLAQHGYE